MEEFLTLAICRNPKVISKSKSGILFAGTWNKRRYKRVAENFAKVNENMNKILPAYNPMKRIFIEFGVACWI